MQTSCKMTLPDRKVYVVMPNNMGESALAVSTGVALSAGLINETSSQVDVRHIALEEASAIMNIYTEVYPVSGRGGCRAFGDRRMLRRLPESPICK